MAKAALQRETPGECWLVKLPAASDETLATLLTSTEGARAWRAVDSTLVYAYVDTVPVAQRWAAAPSSPSSTRATVVHLQCAHDIAGASAGQSAPFHYIVETDVRPEMDDELNAWYQREHLPGLAAVPGTVRARRYIDPRGTPRYYACYDFTVPETLGSPAWLAVRGTPWSDRVRSAFRNTRRTMFRSL
jgi:hypothetical protein